jgi:hypothetical protein
MTSQVNPYNIDGTYPVAGQDNDSQGFRDNFTNTRNNFAFVKSELEDLQSKVLLKAPLNNTTLNNDLSASGTTLNNAQLTAFSTTYYNNGSLSGSQTINYNQGNFQRITTGGSLTVGFSNWPTAGVMGRLILWVNVTSTAYTLTLPSQVTLGSPTELAGINGGNIITFDATGDYLYEFISSDYGASYFCRELTRAPGKVHGPLTVTGNVTVNGNLTLGGGRIESGYQYSAATNGFTLTATPNVSRVILDPASTIAGGTVTLPAGNVDARTIHISSTATITAFQVLGNSGTTVKPSANVTLTAGTQVGYFYHASEATWYKIL